MQNLTTRAVSAFVAVFLVGAITYFFKTPGVLVLCVVASLVGIFETAHLLFSDTDPKFSKRLFSVLTGSAYIFLIGQDFVIHFHEVILLVFILIVTTVIVFHKKFQSLESVFSFVGKFISGLIYSAILPALIVSILKSNQDGILWFLCLLTVVFAGDIGAYIFGSLFGKTKVAPMLSPKKSLQGSLGGLLFSALAGLVFSYIIPGSPVLVMVILGFFGGFLGQIGDFFESLIKRLAGVKDSGSIMPGHGGVLDRLDGVYFASPLFYFVINYIIKS